MLSAPQDAIADQLKRLLTIMDELREGCPWDRKQTLESLRHLTLEEVHELSEAILEQDWDELKKELGDLLLHLVFYARIAREQGQFDFGQVIDELCNKLIRRHPHIYGDTQATNAEQVKANWEQIKQQERQAGQDPSVLRGVPSSLPPLLKAYRMQEKAAGVGFDWPEARQVGDKVEEEFDELRQELEAPKPNRQAAEEELGDLFFALINFARHHDLNPEDALTAANRKFERRFRNIEQQAAETGRPLQEFSLEELEAFWSRAKTLGL